MLSRRNDTNWSLVGEMRVGKMRVGKMRAGEMRVGEMSLTHTVTQAVVCSKTRFVSLLSVCKREPCHNCRK